MPSNSESDWGVSVGAVIVAGTLVEARLEAAVVARRGLARATRQVLVGVVAAGAMAVVVAAMVAGAVAARVAGGSGGVWEASPSTSSSYCFKTLILSSW